MYIEIYYTAGDSREYCVFVESYNKPKREAVVISLAGIRLRIEPIMMEDFRFRAELPQGLTWNQLEEVLFKALAERYGEPLDDILLTQQLTYSDRQLITRAKEVLEDLQERARVGKMALPSDISHKINQVLPELAALAP